MELDDDDRAFVLKWTRTWREDRKKEDFIGRDPTAPDMFARVMFAADHPDHTRRGRGRSQTATCNSIAAML